MSYGVIVAGTEHFEESRWHDDTLEGLPYDDILWGYMVRICEEQRAYGANVHGEDPVFNRLMTMGTFNWTHEDTSLYAPSQAIRFSTALASRLASRNKKLGGEVNEILFVFRTTGLIVVLLDRFLEEHRERLRRELLRHHWEDRPGP